MKTLILFLLFFYNVSIGRAQFSYNQERFAYPIMPQHGHGYYMVGGLLDCYDDPFENNVQMAYLLAEDYSADSFGNAAYGDTVFAFGDGVVTSVTPMLSGYELHIKHDMPAGRKIESVYLYLSAVYCTVGSVVAKGDPVGEIGDAGNDLGARLFFEVRRKAANKQGKNPYALYASKRSGGRNYDNPALYLSPSVCVDDMGNEKVFELFTTSSRGTWNYLQFDSVSRQSTAYVRYKGRMYTLAQARAYKIISHIECFTGPETGYKRMKAADMFDVWTTYAVRVRKSGATLHVAYPSNNAIAYRERAKTDLLNHLTLRGGLYHLDTNSIELIGENNNVATYSCSYYRTRRDYLNNKPSTAIYEQNRVALTRTIIPNNDPRKTIVIKPNFTQ